MTSLATYILYATTILICVLFAYMSDKKSIYINDIKVINKKYFWLSALTLLLLMGLRSFVVGVDGTSYYIIFNRSVSNGSFFQSNLDFTEFGYLLINKIVYFVGKDFQIVIFICSFITIIGFYKAIEYESSRLPVHWMVFVFATTQYFYYFSIIRLGMAAAVIAYSMRFIIENKSNKFVLFVLIASLFHISALLMLVLVFLRNSKGKMTNQSLLFVISIIPLSFLFLRIVIFPLLVTTKYRIYTVTSGGFDAITPVSSIVLLLFFYMFYRKGKIDNPNIWLYVVLFVMKIVLEFFSPLLGSGRTVWFLNISLCYLFASIIKSNFNKADKIFTSSLVIIYCIFYSINAYFYNTLESEYIVPYKTFYDVESKVK